MELLNLSTEYVISGRFISGALVFFLGAGGFVFLWHGFDSYDRGYRDALLDSQDMQQERKLISVEEIDGNWRIINMPTHK